MAKKKFTIRKYDGDDIYSWAVFRTEDVKGMGNQIFYGEAKPVVSGLSYHMAKYYRDNRNEGKK